MALPYSVDELKAATWDLLAANELPSCYIRPIVFYGYGELGVSAKGNPLEVVIMSWPWGAYLGDEGMRRAFTKILSSDEGVVRYTFRGRERTMLYRKSPVTGWWYAFGTSEERRP